MAADPSDPRERADEIARRARAAEASGSTPAARRDRGLLIFFGVVILLGGIALLAWSSAHEPTVANAVAGEWVLKRDYYSFFRFAGWSAVAIGGLMSLAAILRKARS